MRSFLTAMLGVLAIVALLLLLMAMVTYGMAG